MEPRPVRRALLSVSDKTGLIDFARGLVDLGVEIVSTGGTARALRGAGVEIVEIGEFTGFPEILDGRVKTLHPSVHAGILFRRDLPAHVETMDGHRLGAIDLVAVNLYPFEATVARSGTTRAEAIEQIDIGGPAMIRSAAKNHESVTVVVSPERYAEVLEEMRARGGATSIALRRRLALEAFERTASYDGAIRSYLRGDEARAGAPAAESPSPDDLPESLEIALPLERRLRYGENPHQRAALYGSFLARLRQIHGKELSYNNILDFSAAQEMVEHLGQRGPAVVIVKHSNPCGAAIGETIADAWSAALATDPQSASGGIIAASRVVDGPAAAAMQDHFIEILAAPGFMPEALEVLRKRKNRILLEVSPTATQDHGLQFRSVRGGVLVQTRDTGTVDREGLRVVTRREPTDAEWRALRFGWDVVRFVKSNAIVFAAADRTLGVGAGQMSRVDSVVFAAHKARDAGLDLRGAAVASDAFFPFADGLIAAAERGATAVIQPGGSVRDQEVIAAADERGLAMVFTGMRHFRH